MPAGIFVQASGVLPAGTVAHVTLNIPSGPPISLLARVLRVAGADCMGMQFENLTPTQAKGLQDFLLPVIAAAPSGLRLMRGQSASRRSLSRLKASARPSRNRAR